MFTVRKTASREKALRTWKKQEILSSRLWDLSAVALETMPKQVNRDKVLDNLLELHCARAENPDARNWDAFKRLLPDISRAANHMWSASR
jgi:hypothetical protein